MNLSKAMLVIQVIVMADGQVTRGSEVVKPNVRKVRLIGDNKVIGGFAGGSISCRIGALVLWCLQSRQGILEERLM